MPKPLKPKLTPRWKAGTYLGLAPSSNEHYTAAVQGNVVKLRSVWGVVESRWSAEALMKIVAAPSVMCPIGSEDIGNVIRESLIP